MADHRASHSFAPLQNEGNQLAFDLPRDRSGVGTLANCRIFLRAAREQEKIASLHTKGVEREVLDLLDQYDLTRVIVHWYSGPLDIFRELVARGVYFTVWSSSGRLRRIW
jgi:hypothetical protein